MKKQILFQGFPRQAITFLRRLRRNNNREWFLAHREEYEALIREPSLEFIEVLRGPLLRHFPHLLVNRRSMFRINRDTRFSSDKSPYKTWIGYDFRDQRGDRDQAPSLYLGWDPTGVAYGAGHYMFESGQRARFRARITEGASAVKFQKIVKKLKSDRKFQFRGLTLKRIPPGFDPQHPNAEFLRCNALYVVFEEDLPAAFHRSEFVKRTVELFRKTVPLMDWFMESEIPVTRVESPDVRGSLVKIHRDDF